MSLARGLVGVLGGPREGQKLQGTPKKTPVLAKKE